MANLLIGTNVITEDEPCLSVVEMDYQSPGNRGFRRYRAFKVIRDGKVAEFREDVGPSRLFWGQPRYSIPGGFIDRLAGRIYIWETVGELRDMLLELHAMKPTNLEQQLHANVN